MQSFLPSTMSFSANSRAKEAAEAWQLGLFKEKKVCVEAFSISHQTLDRRLNDCHSLSENGGNGRKLNDSLKEAVCSWIDRCGKFNLTSSLNLIRDTANHVLRLNNSKKNVFFPPVMIRTNQLKLLAGARERAASSCGITVYKVRAMRLLGSIVLKPLYELSLDYLILGQSSNTALHSCSLLITL